MPPTSTPELECNRRFLGDVCALINRDGEFKLLPHYVRRLREIQEQLVEDETPDMDSRLEAAGKIIAERMAEFNAVTEQRNALLAACGALVEAIDFLVADSYGVAGLHQNGDVAPWSELTS